MTWRFTFILIMALTGFGCAPAPETTAEKDAEVLPNFIIIYTDDHGYADLGIMDITNDIKTPNIDALARSGALMTQGYVTSPICSPSRAGLLSGQYQNAFEVESNFDFMSSDGIEQFDRVENIAERLKAKNYQTGMAGKWHVGRAREVAKHGFDVFLETRGVGKHTTNLADNGEIVAPYRFKEGYHLDLGAEFSTRFIIDNADQPFFLYWAPRAPHVPVDATPEYLKRVPWDMPVRRRHALAMMLAVDDGVGKIIETLEAQGLRENTLIFFISDNGAPTRITMPDRGAPNLGWNGSINTPLTGEKTLLMEGGIRVPFMASWPGKIPEGLVYEAPVLSLDVAATFMAQTGEAVPDIFPGKNLIPYLRGENKLAPHDTLYWKFLSQSAMRQDNMKLIRFEGRSYLYDLDEDPAEAENLAERFPNKRAAMEKALQIWIDEMPEGETDPEGNIIRLGEFYKYYLDHNEDIAWDFIMLDIDGGLSPSDLMKESAAEVFDKKNKAE